MRILKLIMHYIFILCMVNSFFLILTGCDETTKDFQVIRDQLKNGSLGPEMVKLPRGTFQMGRESYRESPMHEVYVNGFAIGKYEVTIDEFEQFIEGSKYKTEAEQKRGFLYATGCFVRTRNVTSYREGYEAEYNWKNWEGIQGGAYPVVCVSWNDAIAYTEWLSDQTGFTYRLPTEAEWEYAARANTTTEYSFGDNVTQLGEYAWYDKNSNNKTHPVGEKKPNPWGLYGVHGNVSEWVHDFYDENYYSVSPKNNPRGPDIGDQSHPNHHVFRGGSWEHSASQCRSAYRPSGGEFYRSINLGFRIAREIH